MTPILGFGVMLENGWRFALRILKGWESDLWTVIDVYPLVDLFIGKNLQDRGRKNFHNGQISAFLDSRNYILVEVDDETIFFARHVEVGC